MQRLPFVLPDFTRLMWVSDRAREVWAPRLQRITRAWLEIEWRAVVAGLRRCAITSVSPDGLVSDAARWLDHGLAALPLEMQGAGTSYANTAVALEAGRPFAFRTVIGRLDDLQAFRAAWKSSDETTLGLLLGYPSCCTTFFRRVWVEDAMVDTTWPMASASAAVTNGTRTVAVAGPPEANILWRWMGVRAVPHLPCRFDCQATVDLARQFLAVGREAGYREEMDWLVEILGWPIEWSALHGIAEVRTPILKVSTRTDATPVTYVVRRPADAYPAEGARGLGFPYQSPPKPRLTTSLSFRRGMSQVLPVPQGRPLWYATDNGFPTPTDMDVAHAPIVALAVSALGAAGGAVLDLGCGNGALLAKVREAAAGVVPFGIDCDGERIAHACALVPEFAHNFRVGDLAESDVLWADGRRYALALVMPGRLIDAGPDRAAWLRERLGAACDRILVYAYGDWLTRYGSLDGLAHAAGLSLVRDEGAVGLAHVMGER
jgi:2-polyprenyl-3-methyl-5-hydroxy-6-metoxy-1,4-benzoquinol methylase